MRRASTNQSRSRVAPAVALCLCVGSCGRPKGVETGPDGGAADTGAGVCSPALPPLRGDEQGDGVAGVQFGPLRTHATMHSVSVEWDLVGDTDHDARAQVKFRRQGDCAWIEALPLFRNDYAWYWDQERAPAPSNNFAGSILFLTPGNTYEVWIAAADPDGGAAERRLTVKTRSVPVLPRGGRTLHVEPGDGGGDGTAGNPFRGLPAADAAARPGDTLLLHAGHYAGAQLLRGGGAPGGGYLVVKAAGDGEARLDSLALGAAHVWVEGLTFRRAEASDFAALKGVNGAAVTDVVVVRNDFSGYSYAVLVGVGGAEWVITDNVIVGDKTDGAVSDLSGEGIELRETPGHTVAYNRISLVADGVSYPLRDCDIFGNDIFDVTDDLIEADRGFANIRVWGNRLTNGRNAALSFQPQKLGPWYFIRNQILSGADRSRSIFKFRVQDRFVLVNNTLVGYYALSQEAQRLLLSYSRNNLFIHAGGGSALWRTFDRYDQTPTLTMPSIWQPDYRGDVDYDGFDYDSTQPVAFYWYAETGAYRDLAAFQAAIGGFWRNARRVERASTFATWELPATPGAFPVDRVLTLKPGGDAVDQGVPVPQVTQGFTGAAPDLGAYELGRPLPHYGPRGPAEADAHGGYWARY